MKTKDNVHVLMSALLALVFFGWTARADIIPVQGSTSGAFFDSANANQGTQIGHLTFTGNTFGPINSDQALTLGIFDLSNGTFDYNNFTFNLLVNFTVPSGTSGSPVTADISGSVHGGDGSVTIDFPDTPTHFLFANNSASGSFDLTVQDLTVDLGTNNGIGSVTGSLSNVIDPPAAVPEPGSFILFASCVTGIGVIFRKRLARG